MLIFLLSPRLFFYFNIQHANFQRPRQHTHTLCINVFCRKYQNFQLTKYSQCVFRLAFFRSTGGRGWFVFLCFGTFACDELLLPLCVSSTSIVFLFCSSPSAALLDFSSTVRSCVRSLFLFFIWWCVLPLSVALRVTLCTVLSIVAL